MFVPSSQVAEPTACWFLILILMMAVVSSSQSYLQQQSTVNTLMTSTANNSSSNPYWRRPGCYRVGHTRTISIPGCVKFDLTTNACRGYCMSYSIPASEDEPSNTFHESSSSSSSSGGSSSGSSSNFQMSNPQQNDLTTTTTTKSADLETTADGKLLQFVPEDSSNQMRRFSQMIRDHNNNQHHSHSHNNHQQYSGNTQVVGGLFSQDQLHSGEKRDVVSVSQCCNMMETEDVVVNLRCGANEIRRLVFKSAKTCECFFCKHV